jgi:hypothetical protein
MSFSASFSTKFARTFCVSICAAAIGAATTLTLSTAALASDPTFNNITNQQAKDVISDFSGLLNHTSVSSAAPLGDLFGFEFGLVGGMVTVPGVEAATKAAAPGTNISDLPHAALYGAVSVPLGFTFEVNFLPSFEASDIDLKNQSLAVKWTFSSLLGLPLDLALRASMTKSELEFTQDQPVAGTRIEFESETTGLMLLASKSFVIVEPFVGVGTVSADGDLRASTDLFADVAGLSVSEKVSGAQYLAGVNFNLLLLKVGLEAGKLLDQTKLSGKVSLYF